MRRLASVFSALLFGCGAATPHPSEPEAPEVAEALGPLSREAVARALLERFALPYCEADHCLDPFPLWAVSGMAVSHDRIALAGPGALVSLYEHGAWTTVTAPIDEGEDEADRTAVHAVGFSTDGASLVAVGAAGRVYDASVEGLRVRAQLPFDPDVDGGNLVDVIVVASDDLWILQAEGHLFRLHGGEVSERALTPPLHHLVSMGSPLEEALLVTGPFGGGVVRGGFSESAPPEEPFLLHEHLENLGLYSGCGPSMFDPRGEELEELAAELMEQRGLDYDAAYAEAEGRLPPSEALRAPAGVDVPRSGLPAAALVEALESTPEGRALLPIVETPPAWTGLRVTRRRGDAVAIASRDWEGHPELWVRFGSRGRAFDAGSLRRSGLGAIAVLDVSGDQAVMVDARGALLRLRAGEETATVSPPHRELLRATALLIVGNDRALVATEDRVLVEVGLADLSIGRALALPGIVRALEGEAGEIYGVGDDGLVVSVTEGDVVRLESSVSADLETLLVLGPRRLVVGGAAGTVLHLDEGRPRALPRITSDRIQELLTLDGVLYAETLRGVTLEEDAGRLLARPSSLPESSYPGSHAGLLLRFSPADGAPFAPRTTPLSFALDEPRARAPFGALRGTFDPASDLFPADRLLRSAPFRATDLATVIFAYDGGTYCCDPGDAPSDGELLIAAVSYPDCSETDCEAFVRADLRHRLLSTSRETHVSVTRAGSGCPPFLVEVFALDDARSVARETIDCADGEEAQRSALLAHLATLDLDGTWEPSHTQYELPEELRASGTGFFARSARGRVEIVHVDHGNREETVVLRLPRGAPALAAPVPVQWRIAATSGYTMDVRFSSFEGPGLFWAGRTPGGLLVDEDASPLDPATCERLLVADSDGHTTLRAAPTSRSDALATLRNGTRVTVGRREGHWIAIVHPRIGWLFDGNVICAE
jgi:hypothetical protein